MYAKGDVHMQIVKIEYSIIYHDYRLTVNGLKFVCFDCIFNEIVMKVSDMFNISIFNEIDLILLLFLLLSQIQFVRRLQQYTHILTIFHA